MFRGCGRSALVLAAAVLAAGCGSGPSQVEERPPAVEPLAPDVAEKVEFSIRGLGDPDLFDASFAYICDVGKPAVPHLLKALDTDDGELASGISCTLQGITGYRARKTGRIKTLAREWRDWWAANAYLEMPIPPEPQPAAEKPPAEVVAPGPRQQPGSAPGERWRYVLPDTVRPSAEVGPASEEEKQRARDRLRELLRQGSDETAPEKTPETAPEAPEKAPDGEDAPAKEESGAPPG